MGTYSILLNILDKIREEAPEEFNSYRPSPNDVEKINNARSKAYIHLFLMAHLGILNFLPRENFITDGVNDGGVDGYHIDNLTKTIYFIQSKFRTTESNFEEKEIRADEVLRMDINRILDGETCYENGAQYNNKILEMQRKIREIPDIARYRYEVIILANLSKVSESKLRLLTGGFPCKVFDHKKAYTELVFPVVTGTYYSYSEINISVNLGNKSAGAKINYSVETELGTCDITVLFIPLKEVGKLMFEYKNSILKYNPRSFLTLNEGTVNNDIKLTATRKSTNEFALFNNGITILSDETYFNEKIGQKDKAQLSLKNPQIINGGQTAFTLSTIFEEALSAQDNSLFEKLESKEVLVKVITFGIPKEASVDKKLELIESISNATNRQSAVNNADRNSNNKLIIDAQKKLFADFGILLERKRGEFYDGIRYGYINKNELVDRSIFIKIAFSSLGYLNYSRKDKKVFTEQKIELALSDASKFKKYYFGCLCYGEILKWNGTTYIGQAKTNGIFAIISLCGSIYYDETKSEEELKTLAQKCTEEILKKWSDFEEYISSQLHNSNYFKYDFNFRTKSFKVSNNFSAYYHSIFVAMDINDYFGSGKLLLPEDANSRNKLWTVEKELHLRNITPEAIKNIQPLINVSNWYDNESQQQISQNLGLDPKQVLTAIQLITSRKLGYYLTKLYKLH